MPAAWSARLRLDLLWTEESATAMRKLMRLAESDSDVSVRTRALEHLGRFILLGEYGDIAADLAEEAQTLTYGLYQNPAAAVGSPPARS